MSNSKLSDNKKQTTKRTSSKKETIKKTSQKKTTVKAKQIKKAPIKEEIKNDIIKKEKVVEKESFFTKKKLIIFAIILVIILSFIIIPNLNKSTKTITLETHANEVSEWKYEFKDKGIIKFVDKKRFGDIEGKTQEGLIKEKYKFKAIKPGKTMLRFTFINTKNKSFGDIKEYYITVDKDLKLTIEENTKNVGTTNFGSLSNSGHKSKK